MKLQSWGENPQKYDKMITDESSSLDEETDFQFLPFDSFVPNPLINSKVNLFLKIYLILVFRCVYIMAILQL